MLALHRLITAKVITSISFRNGHNGHHRKVRWDTCVCGNHDAQHALKFVFKRRHNLDCGLETSGKLPALRAEVIGQSVGSDANPLSCY